MMHGMIKDCYGADGKPDFDKMKKFTEHRAGVPSQTRT